MNISFFKTAQKLITGQGSVCKLNEQLLRLGIKNPMIVTDKVIESTGLIDTITSHLNGLNFKVFNEVEPEPEFKVVENCKASFLEGKHDGLIAVGGGSAIDIAKVISVYAYSKGDLTSLFNPENISIKGIPLIAIPTTSGTGSEVTNIAVLSDKEAKIKRGVVSDYLLPDVAIVAPEMMVTMPKSVTAASGVDALVHAIEAYISVNASLITDALALHAIALITKYLPKAYANGNDLNARENMAIASLMAGMAFGNAGVGAVHALAYPLGGRFNIPHGVSNALLLPFVMDWNKISCVERFRAIAEAMGENVTQMPDYQAADKAVLAMKRICRIVNIPESIHTFNIPESAIPEMAEDASKIERLLKNNPRLFTKKEIEDIYRSAY